MRIIKKEDADNHEAPNTALSTAKLNCTATKGATAIKRELSPNTDADSADEQIPTAAAKKQRRGRPPGNSSFTKEQDAYIMQLRQEGKSTTLVHRLFEERFNTGSNPKRIKNRYFAIKDECLLNELEENILIQAIEEIETDMAGAIVKRFKELSNGKSVTKSYVMKKMKSRQTRSKA
ncbi:hypothetical protein TWF696_001587 [Orbilia brochopaga]|uniref:Uncharacterized protein n=1 Tax=Orbilia brochopaga TaxID=3140254 RepID=A0AAV9U9V6_9PEZI